MNTIKKLGNQDKSSYKKYLVNGELYRGYMIGDLPSKFGCITWDGGYKPAEGIKSWYSYKGLTLVSEEYFPKWG